MGPIIIIINELIVVYTTIATGGTLVMGSDLSLAFCIFGGSPDHQFYWLIPGHDGVQAQFSRPFNENGSIGSIFVKWD
jgi:hypothetical protein